MTTTQERRAERLDRFEHMTELPLLVLALLIIPLLVAPVAFDLAARVERVVLALDWIIWGVFAAELAIRIYLTPRRLRYLRQHWFDVLIVVLPFLRPLRIVRSARALQALRVLRGARVLVPGVAHDECDRGTARCAGRAAVRAWRAHRFGRRDHLRRARLGRVDRRARHGGVVGLHDRHHRRLRRHLSGHADWSRRGDVPDADRDRAFGLLTANVAAYFVETAQDQSDDPAADALDEVLAELRRLHDRLDAAGIAEGGAATRDG